MFRYHITWTTVLIVFVHCIFMMQLLAFDESKLSKSEEESEADSNKKADWDWMVDEAQLTENIQDICDGAFRSRLTWVVVIS